MVLWTQRSSSGDDLWALPVDRSAGRDAPARIEDASGIVGESSTGIDAASNAVVVGSPIGPTARISACASRYTAAAGRHAQLGAPVCSGPMTPSGGASRIRCKVWRLSGPLLCAGMLAGCAATTTVTRTPPDAAPVCAPESDAKVSVVWRTQWRPDQKDVPAREAAAAEGIRAFFAQGRCFRSATVARADGAPGAAGAQADGKGLRLLLTVRELGPTVKLLSSAALVEGGTEVVFDVTVLDGSGAPARQPYSVRWADGGPGVVKGVGSLAGDMASALRVGLGAP